jgi:hypothetical protein
MDPLLEQRGLVLVLISANILAAAARPSFHKLDTSGAATDTNPTQIHLAFAGSATTSMAVGWLTCNTTTTPSPYVPLVRFGVVSGSYTGTSVGTTSRYFIHYHHDVVLENLTSGTTYFYTVGDANGASCHTFSFSLALACLHERLWPFYFWIGGVLTLVLPISRTPLSHNHR